jgi:hypothetical protein
MKELQMLIGWATVERAKVHRSHLYHKQYGNEWAAFGYDERCRTFDLIIENAELILHGTQPNSEQEPHLQQTAVTRSAPCSKDGCSNEAVCGGYCAAHCDCPA